MISGNKTFILIKSLSLCCLFCFDSYSFSQVKIDVVYPKEGQVVTATDLTFIFGSVSDKNATLFINQHQVKPYKNGTFLAYLPVEPDSFVFHCTAILGTDTTKVLRRVFIPKKFITIPTDSLAIDSNYVLPKNDLQLSPGEYLKVAFQGTPGKTASFSIPGIISAPVKMIESPPFQEAYWGEAVFGAGEAIYAPQLKGVYQGIIKIPINLLADSGYVQFTLKDENGAAVTSVSDGQVIVRDNTIPVIAEIVHDGTVGRTGPGLGYNIFLEKGTQVIVTGKYDSYYKLSLNESSEVWVPESSLKFMPKGTAPPVSVISVVRADDIGDKVRIRLYMQNKLPFRINQENEAGTLLLSVFNARSNTDWIRHDFKTSFIRELSWQQPENDLYQLKIDFDTNQQWGYNAYYNGNILTIDLKKPPKKFSLKNLIIVVDPGHAPQEGSIGPTGVPEKKAVLDIALVLKDKLEDKGAKVYLTRHGQHGANLRVRAKLAQYLDADMFLSLHYNALPDGVDPFKSRGTSTFYYHPQSLPLAASIQKQLLKKLKLPNFGLYYDNLFVCRITQMPSVLIEPAFIMHPEEEMKIHDSGFRKKTANAIVKGIEEFLEDAKKAAENNRKF